jgi:hypothetical protein
MRSMVTLIRQLGPLAAGVVLFGALIAVLVQNGHFLGNWLFAAFLFGHGWVHAMYVMPQPKASAKAANGAEWPFELGHSWLLSPLGVAASAQRTLGALLVVGTIIGFAAAALATVPLLLPASLWPSLVVGSAVTSLLLIGLFFNPNLLIGVAIDLILLWVAVQAVWLPAV